MCKSGDTGPGAVRGAVQRARALTGRDFAAPPGSTGTLRILTRWFLFFLLGVVFYFFFAK